MEVGWIRYHGVWLLKLLWSWFKKQIALILPCMKTYKSILWSYIMKLRVRINLVQISNLNDTQNGDGEQALTFWSNFISKYDSRVIKFFVHSFRWVAISLHIRADIIWLIFFSLLYFKVTPQNITIEKRTNVSSLVLSCSDTVSMCFWKWNMLQLWRGTQNAQPLNCGATWAKEIPLAETSS